MSRQKKSFLLAFIAPVIMTTGCQMTPKEEPNFALQNNAVKEALQPLNEFYTGHALLGCENRLNIDNYDEVMRSRVSGTYGSPLANNSCIPISFDEFEPDEFYQDIISKASDPAAAEELIEQLKNEGYSEGMDGMHIHKIGLENGSVAQIMRFNDGETFEKLKSMWRDRDEMLAFIDEYVFLHELFHLASLNFDKSLPTNVREGMSDVSTVMVLSTKHNLTLQQTIDLAEDVYHGRRIEASRNPYGEAFEGTHFNKDILLGMISYLEQLQDRGGELQRFASLREANEYAMDMVLDLNSIERRGYANGDVYWERGMEIPEQEDSRLANNERRRSFADVLTVAKDLVSKNTQDQNLSTSKKHSSPERERDESTELGF